MQEKMKILIAYDGSSFADAALADLTRAGLPAEAEVVMMSVAEISTPALSHAGMVGGTPMLHYDQILSHERRVARELAESAAQQIRPHFPGWAVRTEGFAGSTARQILLEADVWRPDLIVIGSHGRSALTRFLIGSVTMPVLHNAACAVRVVRGEVKPADLPIRNIIAVDGSPHAAAAVEAAIQGNGRNWPVNTEFRLVTSYGPFRRPHGIGLLKAEKQWAEKAQADGVARLKAAGLQVTNVVRMGDPKRVLMAEARRWKADCVFVGARGLNAFERILLGSVSSALAAHAPCSVEVIHLPPASLTAAKSVESATTPAPPESDRAQFPSAQNP